MSSDNQKNKMDPVGYRFASIRIDDANQIKDYCKTRKDIFGKDKFSCKSCPYSSHYSIGCMFTRQPNTWRTDVNPLIL